MSSKSEQQDTPSETSAAIVVELPPEEGLRGWLCVIGANICIFSSFGFLNAIGVFQTFYQETLLRDYSASSISWIFALQLALMYFPGPLYGRIIDTYGPAPLLYPCSFLCVFGICMTSLSTQFYQIVLAQGLVFGVGSGGVFTAATVCVGQWFVRRRGLAVGLATVGSSVGGVIFPVFLESMISKVGFGGALRYTALFIGVLLCASLVLIRPRLPRKKWNSKAPWFDLALFKQKTFAFYTVGAFLAYWGLFAPFDFLPGMALNSGFSSTLAFHLVSIMKFVIVPPTVESEPGRLQSSSAGSVPGRVLVPYLGDVVGHFNAVTAAALISGVSMLALWLPFNYYPSHAGIIVFAIIYGFSSGAFVSVMMPCVFKLGDLETLGQRFGNFQIAMGLSCLTGLPIMGAILNRQHDVDFSGLQIFSSACCILGAGFLAFATHLLSRSRATWKV